MLKILADHDVCAVDGDAGCRGVLHAGPRCAADDDCRGGHRRGLRLPPGAHIPMTSVQMLVLMVLVLAILLIGAAQILT